MNGWLPEEVTCRVAAFPNLWLPFFIASDVVFLSTSHGSQGGISVSFHVLDQSLPPGVFRSKPNPLSPV